MVRVSNEQRVAIVTGATVRRMIILEIAMRILTNDRVVSVHGWQHIFIAMATA